MHQPTDVEQLVAAARPGDAAAWDDLVDRYLPLVTAVIGRLRLSPADADDVNQTVWLRLVEHLDGLREPRALPGWLATTTRNEGLQLIRRRARDLPVDPGDDRVRHAPRTSDPGEALVEDLRSHALREALLELPENRRELLLLLLADPLCPTRRSVPVSGSPGAASVRPGHVPWNSCAALGRCAAGQTKRP